MRRDRFFLWPLILVGSLAGCASAPDIRLSSTGSLPTEGTFAFADQGDLDSRLASTLSERLRRRGLQPSEQPNYLLQVAAASRPAKAGLFAPDQQAKAWLRDPFPRSGEKQSRALVLTLSERGSGNEIYRLAATGSPGASEDSLLAALLEAAVPESSASHR